LTLLVSLKNSRIYSIYHGLTRLVQKEALKIMKTSSPEEAFKIFTKVPVHARHSKYNPAVQQKKKSTDVFPPDASIQT
jgi:hypothetical protein